MLWRDSNRVVWLSSSSIPARPASETGRKKVMLILFNPNCLNPSESETAATAGAEMTQKCGLLGVNRVLQNSLSLGNHGLGGKSLVRALPVKSITIAPAARAALKLRAENSREPVKNTNRALSKLPSSTGRITAGSPPAS